MVDNSNEYEYKNAAQDILPKNEVQIYTWPDATLREIATLLKGVHNSMLNFSIVVSYFLLILADVIPTCRQRNAALNFCIVYPDKRGIHVMKQVSY
jgi:hypothetical protein